jgi:outer membrane protein, heavy metal efflux system
VHRPWAPALALIWAIPARAIPVPPVPTPSPDEAALAQQASLDAILRIALARNPALQEADERVLASRERQVTAARLPDPELKYEQWAVPLSRPYALDQADTLMLGLSQSFPARGSRAAAARGAAEETAMASEERRARAQDLAAQVRRAYFDYAGAEREAAFHLEQLDVATRLVEIGGANYQAGRGTQQDVLRLILEVARLHTDVATLEQRRRSGRALLNTLMARPPDAPLGPPAPIAPFSAGPGAAEPEQRLETSRPELAAAARAVLRSEAALEGARSEARWPGVMVGADTWLMPHGDPHLAYGLMVSVNLPWLNERRRAEVRAAEHLLAADRAALEAARNAALYQLTDAAARLEAAQQVYRLLDTDVVPQARRSFEAARAAYTAGTGNALALLDAMRSVLDARVEQSRALVQLESSLADLERAAGTAALETEGQHP